MDATHNINAFKTEYPLSPKKFWKKMIGTIVGSICWTILIAIVVTGLIEPNDAAEAITLNIIKIFEFSLLAFTFAYVLIRVWYWRAYIRSYFYDGSGDFLTIRKGVFMPTEIHVQWPKIQDVYVDQDIFDRIMGLYDVHIASATVTSGTEAHIDGVDGATMESLKTYLLGRVSGIQTRSTNPASPLAAPAPTTFKLSEPISSKQFPISDTFAFIKILGMFFPNILFGLWIFFIFLDKTPAIEDHPMFSILSIIGISLLSFIWSVVSFLIWKHNYQFEFTPEFVYLHTGILSQSEKHVPYRTIQDVSVTQSFLERIFGLASVAIENAATNGSIADINAQRTYIGTMSAGNKIIIPGQTLANAQKIRDTLKEILKAANPSQTGL